MRVLDNGTRVIEGRIGTDRTVLFWWTHMSPHSRPRYGHDLVKMWSIGGRFLLFLNWGIEVIVCPGAFAIFTPMLQITRPSRSAWLG